MSYYECHSVSDVWNNITASVRGSVCMVSAVDGDLKSFAANRVIILTTPQQLREDARCTQTVFEARTDVSRDVTSLFSPLSSSPRVV